MTNGWVRLDPIAATKEVIAPLFGGLLGMILVPGLGVQLIRHLVPAFTPHRNVICTFSPPLVHESLPLIGVILVNLYPAIFMIAGLIRSSFVVYDILASWSQSIRDKEFLVELRLKNHEPELDKVAENPSSNGGVREESPL